MSWGCRRPPFRLVLTALAAAGLSACAAVFATRGPITVETAMPADDLVACVTAVFNTRDPLVHGIPARDGMDIVVRDLAGATMAAVAIRRTHAGSIVTFRSEHPDRGWYERLLGRCVRLR